MDVRVEVAGAADQELVHAFGRLLPQLSSTAKPLDHQAVERLVASDANRVLVARRPGRSSEP